MLTGALFSHTALHCDELNALEVLVTRHTQLSMQVTKANGILSGQK